MIPIYGNIFPKSRTHSCVPVLLSNNHRKNRGNSLSRSTFQFRLYQAEGHIHNHHRRIPQRRKRYIPCAQLFEAYSCHETSLEYGEAYDETLGESARWSQASLEMPDGQEVAKSNNVDDKENTGSFQNLPMLRSARTPQVSCVKSWYNHKPFNAVFCKSNIFTLLYR